MDQSICLWSGFAKSFYINLDMFCCLYETGRLHFTYRLLVTDNDALHVIHIMFFDLLFALYYFIDLVLLLCLICYHTYRNLII